MRWLSLSLFAICTILTSAKKCRPGYYNSAENCIYSCSHCLNKICIDDKGSCGANNFDLQNYNYVDPIAKTIGTPKCFGDQGCNEGGRCIAPNYCVCGQSGAQTVGVKGSWNGVEGINCLSLRKDGLKGALFAFMMLIIAISTCGVLAPKSENVFKYAKDYLPAKDRRPMMFRNKLLMVVVLFMAVFLILLLLFNRWHTGSWELTL